MASSLTVDPDVSAQEIHTAPKAMPIRSRRLRERISLGHLFMIASGLLAFVLVVSLLQDRSVTTVVLVAQEDILPGTVITPDLVTEVELPADSELSGSLATMDQIVSGDLTAGHRIAANDPITRTALAPASSPAALRAMSIPIDRVDAVGGDLAPGDRVDVIAVDITGAQYVATDLEVLATESGEGRGGALGSSSLSTYYVTVSVDDQTALAIALARENGAVSILRSTGAEPIPGDERRLPSAPATPPRIGGSDQGSDGSATGG